MNDEEYKDLTEKLQKDFVFVRRGRLWHFLGGLVAIGIALGFITWAATLEALKSERAIATIALIEQYAKLAQANAEKSQIALNQANQALNQSISANIGVSKLITFQDGCTWEVQSAEKPTTCEITIPEPNCNWSFEQEQKWCEAHSPCKFTTASVTGIDTAPQTCSYESCSYICNANVVGKVLETRGKP